MLAYVPRLPSRSGPHGFGLASGNIRHDARHESPAPVFAMTQIAFSFVLLAGAGMLLSTVIALQTAPTGFTCGKCSQWICRCSIGRGAAGR